MSELHPAFSPASVRALIARREANGLGPHVYHVGRRVVVDLNGFQQWIREQQGRA